MEAIYFPWQKFNVVHEFVQIIQFILVENMQTFEFYCNSTFSAKSWQNPTSIQGFLFQHKSCISDLSVQYWHRRILKKKLPPRGIELARSTIIGLEFQSLTHLPIQTLKKSCPIECRNDPKFNKWSEAWNKVQFKDLLFNTCLGGRVE